MSLVAAYSDSESESDADDGDKTLSVQQPVNVVGVKASHPIVADKVNDKTTNLIQDTSTEQIKKNVLASSIDDIVDDDDINHNANSNLFSILPQPKAKMSAVVEESDDEFIKKGIEINTEIDEEKPPKRKSLILPSPAQKSNKKQPVKILIPSLEEMGADSDSDDEKSKEKEKPLIKQKTTLFSILPKPKHSVTVGGNRNKVFSFEANRPLIPHTLTKKKDVTKKDKPKSAEKKQGKSLVGDISDSDEENDEEDVGSVTNFFSLSESKSNNIELKTVTSDESSKNEAEKTLIQPERTLKHPEKVTNVNSDTRNQKTILNDASKNKQSVAVSNKKENSFFSNLYKSNSNVDKLTSETNKVKNTIGTGDRTPDTSVDKGISAAPDSNAPQANSRKDFASENLDVTGYSSVTAPYSSVTAPYPSSNVAPYGNRSASYGEANTSYGNMTGTGSIPQQTGTNEKSYPTAPNFFSYAYHKNEPADQSVGTNVENSEIDYYNKPNEDLPIDKDALRALQGSKRRREDINLIEIHADDIQATSSDYLKNLTAESAEQQRLMKSQKDKDQPTSSQKRKHQITYLAHQAKERELLLQQQWAESLATKRQTQSKYGF